MNNEKIIVDTQSLANLCGVSTRRIQQLVNNGNIPKPVKRGEYDLIKSIQTYIAHLQKNTASGGIAAAAEQKKRLLKAQADKAEIELAQIQKELVLIEDVGKEVDKLFSNFKQKLLSLPNKLCHQIIILEKPTESKALLEREIKSVLHELSKGNFTKRRNKKPSK